MTFASRIADAVTAIGQRIRAVESSAPAPAAADWVAIRADAATTAANADAGPPFYWEIGDANSVLASGAVGAAAPTDATAMPIASACKPMYAAYVADAMQLDTDDWPFLNMTSGYHSMAGQCQANATETVGTCLARSGGAGGTTPYDTFTAADVGKFAYDGAHFQHHAASLAGLDADNRAALGQAYQQVFGIPAGDIAFTQPLLAGGVSAKPSAVRTFLQKVLGGTLKIRDLMGTHAVPASTYYTDGSVIGSPAPDDEPWRYGCGWWIEPDGTFCGAGSFGFYFWISADKVRYGIVARNESGLTGDLGVESVRTGQAIRHAYDDPPFALPVPLNRGGTGAVTAEAARAGLGLGNVDNTADMAKPLSTAQSNALMTVSATVEQVTYQSGHSVVASDFGKVIWIVSAINVNVILDATVAPADGVLLVRNGGTGTVTLVGAAGTTLNTDSPTLKLDKQFALAVCVLDPNLTSFDVNGAFADS